MHLEITYKKTQSKIAITCVLVVDSVLTFVITLRRQEGQTIPVELGPTAGAIEKKTDVHENNESHHESSLYSY